MLFINIWNEWNSAEIFGYPRNNKIVFPYRKISFKNSAVLLSTAAHGIVRAIVFTQPWYKHEVFTRQIHSHVSINARKIKWKKSTTHFSVQLSPSCWSAKYFSLVFKCYRLWKTWLRAVSVFPCVSPPVFARLFFFPSFFFRFSRRPGQGKERLFVI